MSFVHCGLFFDEAQLDRARQARGVEALSGAWALLERQVAARDPLACALAFRLTDDAAAADTAEARLLDALSSPPFPGVLQAAGDLIALLQTAELLTSGGRLNAPARAQAADGLAAALVALQGRLVDGAYVERLWLALATLCAGIVLEQPAHVEQAAAVFRQAIEGGEVRPQGFIQPAVEPIKGSAQTAMERQVLATEALILIAEAATVSAGLPLWSLHVRGVSVATAAMYPIYYFYTTERWKWDEDLHPETVQDIFRRHGGWVEIAQARLQHKDLTLLLDDLRPVWDRAGGGMTTLTHGAPAKARRRGLFG